jgi:osmoprotectant transport system substrate-binding protein
MRRSRNSIVGAMMLAMALVVGACTSGGDLSEGTTIEIASFDFGESEIVAEIYAQALAAEGYNVNHQVQVGPREVLKPALESGEVHMIPEYVGSGLEAGFGIEPSADAAATREALIDAYSDAGVTVLELSNAEDKNTFVVTKALAEANGLTKVSDLAKLGPIVLGGPAECPVRPRCQLGLEGLYGLEIAEFKALDSGGPFTVTALNEGAIQVGLFFSTYLFIDEFLALEDDLGLQPAENIVPVISQAILDEYGSDLEDLLNAVSAALTTEALTEMNERFFAPEDADVIARDFLVGAGLIDG